MCANRVSKIASEALLISLILAASTLAQTPSGVVGFYSGGEIGWYAGTRIAVPDDYRVLDVQGDTRVVVVTAYRIAESDGIRPACRSEVWNFPVDRDPDVTVDFEDRRVLVAHNTKDGESKQLALFTRLCRGAIAIDIDRGENGHTLLFDREGNDIAVDWVRADYIKPITFVESGLRDTYRYRLVAMMSEHGDLAPHLAVYDSTAGEVTHEPVETAVGNLGSEIVQAVAWSSKRC